jgi:DNA-binding response OmpR family regulator
MAQPDHGEGPGKDQSMPRPIHIDRARRVVVFPEREVTLTAAELRLLDRLLHMHGRPVTRDLLAAAITDGKAIVEERTVDVHICTLRRKLGVAGLIETTRGVGYRIGTGEGGLRLVEWEAGPPDS